MVKNVFTLADLLAPLYIVFFYFIAYLIVQRKYKGTGLAKHFYWGLTLKFIGCLSFISIYAFYYRGGDTFRYYHNALPIVDHFFRNPPEFLQILLSKSIAIRTNYPEMITSAKDFYRFDMQFSETSFQVVRLVSFFSLFSFKSYIVISLFFAFGSFIGVWCLYRALTNIFPDYKTSLSIPILYFPSVFFWGSSIMKDSVVLGFVGILTYSIYMLFFKKKKILVSIILIILSFIVLKTTKEYVIITFIPAAVIWLFLGILEKAPKIVKLTMRPAMLILAFGLIIVLAPLIGKITEKYALDTVLQTAESTASYIHRVSIEKEGSAYSLGNINYTPIGLMQVFPKAVSVTLYRPFLWEVNNPVMLLSAIESLLVLLITIVAIVVVGPIKLFSRILGHPFLLAAFVFSLFFAFAIGVSTFNFGSLARYKLPCLPFYGVAFIVPLGELMIERRRKKMLKSASLPSSI